MDDAPGVARIHVEWWVTGYRDILPPAAIEGRTVDVREREFREVIERADAEERLWVSERGGEVVGFAYTRVGRESDIPGGGELKLFYVQPELRGSGIGLPLFEHAVGDLEQRGLSPYLYTLQENEAARTWYEKRGWRHDGKQWPWPDYPEIIEVRYRPAERV
jgi:GNAT superfamily N-acetyltransferase